MKTISQINPSEDGRGVSGHVYSYARIRKLAIFYMALPLLCFFVGFLKWYLAIVCSGVLLFTIFQITKEDTNLETKYKEQFLFPLRTIIIVFLFSLLWTYLGGMNGYYYQSSDWDCRNAIYFDLIQYDWPVWYDANGAALVYYVGHWLPPAALAKFAFMISGSVDFARDAGRMLLWVWSSVGLTFIILMIFRVLGVKTKGKQIAAAFIFVFFSGMDLIGAIIRNRLDYLLEPSRLHLEWWFPGFQYTSIMACVFWVFNQAIIPWMITLCFFTEEDPRNYVFYCVVCLLCGTLPCVGLAILMIAKAAVYCINRIKENEGRLIFRRVFSLQNILSFLVLFPMIASYMLSANTAKEVLEKHGSLVQSAYAEEAESTDENDINRKIAEEKKPYEGILSGKYINKRLILFLFCEVAVYMLLLWADHKRDPMFYVLGIYFFFVPYFKVGQSYDFCMRASIPGIFILMLYVNQFLLKHFPLKKDKEVRSSQRIAAVLLAFCFVIGMATPVLELYRGAYNVVNKGAFFLEDQRIMTFNQEHIYNNFLCSNPDNHFFFKYFAK